MQLIIQNDNILKQFNVSRKKHMNLMDWQIMVDVNLLQFQNIYYIMIHHLQNLHNLHYKEMQNNLRQLL